MTMRWISSNADEHVLVDDRGRVTGFKITRDPVTCLYTGAHSGKKLMTRLAIYPVQRHCEEAFKNQQAAA